MTSRRYEKPILVSLLALFMYLIAGSCFPLAVVKVSANDSAGGVVEHRDNGTWSTEVRSSDAGSGVREWLRAR